MLVSAEQYDRFLKAIGVGLQLRKAIPCLTPTTTEAEAVKRQDIHHLQDHWK